MSNEPVGKAAKIPNLPITQVTDPQVRPVVDAIRNIFNTRAFGKDEMEKWVTWRDLVDSNVVQVVKGGTTIVGGSGGTGTVFKPIGDQNDLTPPPQPTGFSVDGAFANIIMNWDDPDVAYNNHAYTEIWRSGTNDRSTAVLIGTARGAVYSDNVGNSSTYYYWIRFVSNADVAGPYNSLVGTVGATSPDPGYLLELLTGEITESQLFSSLASRIDLIDAPATNVNSVAAKIQAEATARAQAILDEASARATADNALDTKIQLLSAASSGDFQDLLAAIETEQTARIDGDAAEALSRETLAAQMRGTYDGTDVTQLTTGLLYSEKVARADADTALSSSITALGSTVTNNYNTLNSAITDEATTRATADTALSTQISTVSATASKSRTYYQAAPPSAGMLIGDLWFDTDDKNKVYRYNGTDWVSSADIRIADNAAAITNEASARATADSALSTQISTVSAAATKTRTYRQASAPTTGMITGDLWFDTDDKNRAYRYSGTAWVLTEDTRIEESLSLITTESTARANADEALATQITTLQASAGSIVGLKGIRFWGFDTGMDGWVGTRATATSSGGTITFTPTTADAYLSKSLPTEERYTGSSAPVVRALVRRVSGTGTWEGSLYYATATHGYSNSYRKTITVPTNPDKWNELEWDMSELTAGGTDYTANQITGLRLDLVSDANTSVWEIDWIGVGTPTVTQNAAALQIEASVRAEETGALGAKYTVKTDVAGHVAGYGLATTANNAPPTSEFGILADSFWVSPPATASTTAPTTNLYAGRVWLDTSVTPNVTKYYTGSAWSTTPQNLPFVVRTTPTTINGVSVPAGVYMQAAYIENGSISNAKIGNAAIDDAKIANLNASKINAGFISADRISLGSLDAKIATITNAQIQSLDAGKINAGFISAARIQANSITADKIDSRGLSIKDASGNIILAAGTALPTSYVTPSERWIGNLIDLDWWRPGAAIPWSQNAEANSLITSTQVGINGYQNAPDTVWYAQEVSNNGESGGGWNASVGPLNPNKTYRFAVPIFIGSNAAGSSGTAYWGTGGVCDLNTTSANGNPYFAYLGRGSMLGQGWHMFVGYVFPYGSTGNSHAGAGVYRCSTGVKIADGFNYCHTASGADLHRAYQYYTLNNAVTIFGRPMIHLVDGSEPPLDSLLGGAISGRNPLNAGNVSTYIANAAIGNAQIANASIDSAKIATASIVAANIADGQITNAKIANAAIDSAKIANAAITSAKIGQAEVDTLRIAGNSVTVSSSIATYGEWSSVYLNAPYGGVINVIVNVDGWQYNANYVNVYLNGGLILEFAGYEHWRYDGATAWTPATSIAVVGVGSGNHHIQVWNRGNINGARPLIRAVALLTQR